MIKWSSYLLVFTLITFQFTSSLPTDGGMVERTTVIDVTTSTEPIEQTPLHSNLDNEKKTEQNKTSYESATREESEVKVTEYPTEANVEVTEATTENSDVEVTETTTENSDADVRETTTENRDVEFRETTTENSDVEVINPDFGSKKSEELKSNNIQGDAGFNGNSDTTSNPLYQNEKNILEEVTNGTNANQEEVTEEKPKNVDDYTTEIIPTNYMQSIVKSEEITNIKEGIEKTTETVPNDVQSALNNENNQNIETTTVVPEAVPENKQENVEDFKTTEKVGNDIQGTENNLNVETTTIEEVNDKEQNNFENMTTEIVATVDLQSENNQTDESKMEANTSEPTTIVPSVEIPVIVPMNNEENTTDENKSPTTLINEDLIIPNILSTSEQVVHEITTSSYENINDQKSHLLETTFLPSIESTQPNIKEVISFDNTSAEINQQENNVTNNLLGDMSLEQPNNIEFEEAHVVLGVIVVLIVALVMVAIYKCSSEGKKSKKNTRELEPNHGTEMKDLESLLPKQDQAILVSKKYSDESPNGETVNLIQEKSKENLSDLKSVENNSSLNNNTQTQSKPFVNQTLAPSINPSTPIQRTRAKFGIIPDSIPRTPIFVQKSYKNGDTNV